MKSGKDYIGVGVGAIIQDDKGQILLFKRSSKLHPDRTTVGMWSVSGGEVNFGETSCDDKVRPQSVIIS